MIKEFEYSPTSELEAQQVKALQCSCLLNLALVYSRQLQWSDVIRACSAVLDLDPGSSKALFRRAQVCCHHHHHHHHHHYYYHHLRLMLLLLLLLYINANIECVCCYSASVLLCAHDQLPIPPSESIVLPV
jgi:hypothetical protein